MARARTPQVGDFLIAWTPDLRARYAALLPYYPWLAEVNEAYQFRMAAQSLYRPAYVFGKGRSDQDKQASPWRETPRALVDAWRARNLAERWATSDATAQALCWLEYAFAGLTDRRTCDRPL